MYALATDAKVYLYIVLEQTTNRMSNIGDHNISQSSLTLQRKVDTNTTDKILTAQQPFSHIELVIIWGKRYCDSYQEAQREHHKIRFVDNEHIE